MISSHFHLRSQECEDGGWVALVFRFLWIRVWEHGMGC